MGSVLLRLHIKIKMFITSYNWVLIKFSRIVLKFKNIPLMGWHKTKALPVNPVLQLHIGMWLITWQTAFCPHAPTHGSTHFLWTQALEWSQSVLYTHSGLQLKYGSPWYSGKQWHWPFIHSAFEPQRILVHSSITAGSTVIQMVSLLYLYCYNYIFILLQVIIHFWMPD